MKKIYLKLMLLMLGLPLMPLSLWAEGNPATMVLDTKEGQTYSFLLSDNIVITYNDTEMLLNDDGVQTAFLIDDVYNFYFTGDLTGSAGIPSLTVSPDMAFRYIAPNVYEITGNSVISIQVCDISGKSVMSSKDNESVTVDLNPFSEGIYIVNAKMQNSTQTIKIVKK